MKKVLCAIVLFFIVLSVSGCVNNTTDSFTLRFVEGHTVSVTVNNINKEYIGIFCDYTNNSGETCMPCDTVNVKAFQNSKELTVVVFTGTLTDDAIQCDTNVQSGTTARVVWLFEKQDNSTISVEFTDGQKFSFKIETVQKEYYLTQPAFQLSNNEICSDIKRLALLFELKNVKVNINNTGDKTFLTLKGEKGSNVNTDAQKVKLKSSNDFVVIFNDSPLTNDALFWFDMRGLPIITQNNQNYCVYVQYDKTATQKSLKTSSTYEATIQKWESGADKTQTLGEFNVTEETKNGYILIYQSSEIADAESVKTQIEIAYYSVLLEEKY